MSDELTLTVQKRSISGWTEVRVTRGVERCTPDFEILMTERDPASGREVTVTAGDICEVRLGGDLVLTGYVDVAESAFSPERHEIRIIGRGKCEDLVDCSAKWPGSQISGASALGIAQRLAKPYNIDVYAADTSQLGPAIPQFNLTLGESAWDVIERVCRYAALLAYEEPDGRLVLTRVGTERAASGVAQGKNVQHARAIQSMADRYSDYSAFMLAIDTFQDAGAGGNLIWHVKDAGVPRPRNLYIIGEGGGQSVGAAVAKQRAIWEMNRRIGRARQVAVTVDSWRDSAGRLWTPNTLLPVELPALKIPDGDLAITEVTYRRSSDGGTTAELNLMLPDALLPEPILLQPYQIDIPGGIAVP